MASAMPKLTFAEIEELGGNREDLALLQGVDEDDLSEMEFEELPSTKTKDAEYREIRAFIRNIGLEGTTGQDKQPPDSKISKKKRSGGCKAIEGRSLELNLMKLSAKSYKTLLIPLDNDKPWFDQSNSDGGQCGISQTTLDHLITVGEKLALVEVELYQKARQKSKGMGDVLWLRTVLSSGTLSDKVAALTLLVQESPVHTLSSLDSLLAMASKKGKRESILAADTLKELWISDLLPEDRKLKSLKQRPVSDLVGESSERVAHRKLLLWCYEDRLKTRFAKFLSTVKLLSHDPVPNIREKMLGCVFDLLYRKPEQEQELLSQLVNKLGDPVKKVASKAVLFLLKLVHHHVNMKAIVAREMEHLLHRPNVSPRAQYYAVCTLNQFVIGLNGQELAKKLVEIYFTFFKVCTQKKELDAKMLAALLTGVNRAFPFVEGDIPSFEDHLQSLFKVVYVGPLATAVQSLVLLYQVMESRQTVSGRYYQALYTKLLDPRLKHSKKQAIFLNLLFKSVKNDPETKRVKAFLKRILQVLKVQPNLWPFLLQSEGADEEHFADVEEEGEGDLKGHVVAGGCVGGYLINGRNPLYCRADTSCLWELARLQSHYHPSVQAFATKIAQGEAVQYQGDPLQDFTLMRFLDRFVYKNPKKKQSDHGGSLMQRPSKLLKNNQKEISINSTQFAALSESKVREDELFMHKYFVCKTSLEAGQKKKDRYEGNEGDSEDDFEEFDGLSQDGMDFAGELDKQKKMPPSKKKRTKKSGSETDSEEEFSGGDWQGQFMSASEIESEGELSGGDWQGQFVNASDIELDTT